MRIVFASAAMLASSVVFSATPIEGWYSSVFGGYTFLPNNINVTRNALFFDNTGYTAGYNVGGRVGYKSTPLRYEGEYTYINSSAKHFNVNNIKRSVVSGDSQASVLMANVYYDFPEIMPAIEPFLGVGLGFAWVEASLFSQGPVVPVSFKGSNSVFAYQATAGFTYNFAENYAVNIAYRYIATQTVNDFNSVFQAHLASVGAIYRFDIGNYK